VPCSGALCLLEALSTPPAVSSDALGHTKKVFQPSTAVNHSMVSVQRGWLPGEPNDPGSPTPIHLATPLTRRFDL
jgi:hypothetical protein